MKALKIIGIIVGVIVAAILIVPLFSPATAEVSSEIDINLEAAQIFPSVASFEGREAWDPWLTTDSTASATIESKPGYVGSTYAWEGEKTGFGKMEVISVTENEYIESHLWFGDVDSPALVEWSFEANNGGSRVSWSFSQETAWPLERLGMMIGKVFLKKSFDEGLANLKEYLEANPPVLSPLGPISIETQDGFEALVASGSGTMEEMGPQLGRLFGIVFAEAGAQQLDIAGPAFVQYLDYDEATGFSNFLAGIPVAGAGKSAGGAMAKSYPEMQVVQGLHTGPYEEFKSSYEALDAYITGNGIEVSGQAFEFYQVDMQQEADPAKWETLITFPLK